MTLGRGTHWKGPLLGSDLSGGGLFEDFPAHLMGSNEVSYWATSFMDHTLAQYWTQTNLTAGTATIAQESPSPILSLTHGTVDQGPSVRWLGTDGRGNTIANPFAVNSSCIFETRLLHQTNVATNDAFVGFMGNGGAGGGTSPATHPLVAAGTIDTTNAGEGAGFHWLDANDGRPLMVAWRGNTLETLVNPPTLATDVAATGRYFGVRIDVGSTAASASVSWYVNRRLIFRHRMSAAFAGKMTFTLGLVSNAAGAQLNIDRLVLARLNTSSSPPE